MEYQIYESGGQYRWRLLAENNRNIDNGGESYHNKSDCLWAINLVKGSGQAPVRDLTSTAAAGTRRW
ncbi:MAG TPA: DUF1508 domain-containing protein [Polyangiaceae bacterium]|nr:DUF1508 domain-containing protein [Polyangiaceae bacterium]